MNQQSANEEEFLAFFNTINEIAQQLPVSVKLRPEQIGSMYAILNSGYKRTFMQLPTGAGKSLMFGLMARYTNSRRGVKVVVVVPNKVLAAI
jgi:superfamily II DNA or RNA helicase